MTSAAAALHSHVDDAADSALDSAAPDRKLRPLGRGVVHTVGVAREIAAMPVDLRLDLRGRSLVVEFHDTANVANEETSLRAPDPALPLLLGPALPKLCHLSENLDSVVPVDDLDDAALGDT